LGDIPAGYLVWQLQRHAKIFSLTDNEVTEEERELDILEHRFYAYQVTETHYVVGDHLLDDTDTLPQQVLIPINIIEYGDPANYWRRLILEAFLAYDMVQHC
jgi:hypothetical protein